MKTSFLFFCFIFSIFSFAQTKGKVVAIKDGDTIVILLADNKQKTIRLAEVDCPENGQPFGKNAKEFTSSQIFGKEVVFYETDNDRYGRTIAKVFFNGKYLSEEIIKSGFGWWYYHYSINKDLGKLQEIAKRNKLGLWSQSNSIQPWEWRKVNK